jgi:ribosomal protein L24
MSLVLPPTLKEVSGIEKGDLVGILRGSYRGKKGTVDQIGYLFLHLLVPGIEGRPIVAKVDVIRIVKKDAA